MAVDLTKFISLNSGIQELTPGTANSSGGTDAGKIVAFNSAGYVDKDAGGTGIDSSGVTNGQILIGNSSGNVWDVASLTPGSNITITPGAGSITIASTGGGGSSLTVNATPYTSDQTFTGTEDNVVSFDVTAGDLTLVLPDNTSNPALVYYIEVLDSTNTGHTLTISSAGSDQFQGGAGNLTVLANNSPVGVISDGAALWNFLSSQFLAFAGSQANHILATDANGQLTFLSDPLTVANGGSGHASLTVHDVLVGNGTSAITQVTPSSTSGVPLVSAGSSADPTFGTAVVAGGGTGQTSFTVHGVIVGNSTSGLSVTAAGAAGTVLTGNGASDPTFQAPTATPNTIQLTASAAISAGNLVNIYDNAGTANVRPADNTSSSTYANGFAPASISMSASGTVVPFAGPISGLSGLTPGTQYFLGTSGGLTTSAPSSSGDLIQSVGVSITASTFQFFAGTPNIIA